jgi:hypothetical protein
MSHRARCSSPNSCLALSPSATGRRRQHEPPPRPKMRATRHQDDAAGSPEAPDRLIQLVLIRCRGTRSHCRPPLSVLGLSRLRRGENVRGQRPRVRRRLDSSVGAGHQVGRLVERRRRGGPSWRGSAPAGSPCGGGARAHPGTQGSVLHGPDARPAPSAGAQEKRLSERATLSRSAVTGNSDRGRLPGATAAHARDVRAPLWGGRPRALARGRRLLRPLRHTFSA